MHVLGLRQETRDKAKGATMVGLDLEDTVPGAHMSPPRATAQPTLERVVKGSGRGTGKGHGRRRNPRGTTTF